MPRKLLIISIFLLSVTKIFSQTTSEIIKELESDLLLAQSDVEKIKIETKLIKLYIPVDLDIADQYRKKAEKSMRRTTPPDDVLADFYAASGAYFFEKGDLKNATKNYKEELKYINKLGEDMQADSIKFNIATIAFTNADFSTANKYYKDLLIKSQVLNDKEMMKRLYKSLYITNKNWRHYKDALFYLEKYLELIDAEFFKKIQKITILSKQVKYTKVKLQETETNLNYTAKVLEKTSTNLKKTHVKLKNVTKEKLQLQNDTLKKRLQLNALALEKAKKEQQLKEQEALNKLQRQELEARRKIIGLLLGIISIIILTSFLISLLYRRIRRQNKILAYQKAEIEQKNKSITESIIYAKNIQQSILLDENTIRKYLPDTFIYFKPRDIVSGDFYWFGQVDGAILISAIDCTGHGVPGAFLSMIGNTLLNKIVNEYKIIYPSLILEYLHEGMMTALQQNQSERFTEDGMDMVFCSIVPEEKIVYFAGAKNSLLVLIDEEIISLKGDFISIGQKPFRRNQKIEFTEHAIKYDEDTILFLTTDGFTDQFGGNGERPEKFNVPRFKEMLIKYRYLKMSDMKQMVTNTMEEWKQDNEQTDDMLVIGVRLRNINLNK